MKKFKFRLATLLRLREQDRTECRAHLAEAFAAEQELIGKKESLLAQSLTIEHDMHQTTQPGPLDIERLRETHRFQLVVATELAYLEEEMAQLAVEIEMRRQAVVAADREVRILENLQHRQQQRHDQDVMLEDIKQLDEIASRTVRQTFV